MVLGIISMSKMELDLRNKRHLLVTNCSSKERSPKERSPRRKDHSDNDDMFSNAKNSDDTFASSPRGRQNSGRDHDDDDMFANTSGKENSVSSSGTSQGRAGSSDKSDKDDTTLNSPRSPKHTFSANTFVAADSDNSDDDDMFGDAKDSVRSNCGSTSGVHGEAEIQKNSSSAHRHSSNEQRFSSTRVSELDWDDKDGYYKTTKNEILGDRFVVVGAEPLGKGNFATVVKCIKKDDDSSAAVKIFRKHLKMSAEREIKTLQRLHRSGAPLSPRSSELKSPMSGAESTPRLTPKNNTTSGGFLLTSSSVTVQRTASSASHLSAINVTELPSLASQSGANNIIRLFDSFDYRGHRCLVLEQGSMTLRKAIDTMGKSGRGVSTTQVFDWAKDILWGLQHLHSNDLAHTNINPENIFLFPKRSSPLTSPKAYDSMANDNNFIGSKSGPSSPNGGAVKNEEWVCKIGGLAACRELKKDGFVAWSSHASDADDVINKSGMRNYSSPEVILQSTKTCDARIDIWSVGCCVFEMKQGRPYISAGRGYQQYSQYHAANGNSGSLREDTDVLEHIIARKGRIPRVVIKGGDKSDRFFDSKGNFLRKEFKVPEVVKEGDNLKAEITRAVYGNGPVPSEFLFSRNKICDFVMQATALDPKSRPYAEKAIQMFQVATASTTVVGTVKQNTIPVHESNGLYQLQGSSTHSVHQANMHHPNVQQPAMHYNGYVGNPRAIANPHARGMRCHSSNSEK